MTRKVLCCLLVFGAALCLIGCDASNAAAGYGGGAVGNSPPNPAQPNGGNAYGTTGGRTVQQVPGANPAEGQ